MSPAARGGEKKRNAENETVGQHMAFNQGHPRWTPSCRGHFKREEPRECTVQEEEIERADRITSSAGASSTLRNQGYSGQIERPWWDRSGRRTADRVGMHAADQPCARPRDCTPRGLCASSRGWEEWEAGARVGNSETWVRKRTDNARDMDLGGSNDQESKEET